MIKTQEGNLPRWRFCRFCRQSSDPISVMFSIPVSVKLRTLESQTFLDGVAVNVDFVEDYSNNL